MTRNGAKCDGSGALYLMSLATIICGQDADPRNPRPWYLGEEIETERKKEGKKERKKERKKEKTERERKRGITY